MIHIAKRKERKPVGITFVFETDYTGNADADDDKRVKALEGMKLALDYAGLEDFDLIALDEKNYIERMRVKNIPEYWLHDIDQDTVIPLVFDFYVIDFNDGTRKIVGFINLEQEGEQTGMMYR